MDSRIWFRHLTQEVFMEARTQDVLCISLIRVEGQLLSINQIIQQLKLDLFKHIQTCARTHTSARSSKQLPTRGWGLSSSVISTESSIKPSSLTVTSWISTIRLKILSTSWCKHQWVIKKTCSQVMNWRDGAGDQQSWNIRDRRRALVWMWTVLWTPE